MINQFTIKQHTIRLARQLAPVAGESAAFEARQLVMAATGLDIAGLLFEGDSPLATEAEARLARMARERMDGRPLQYILGEWEFMGLALAVDERALIPRQDTETLLEHALALSKARGYHACLDLCCGSGCIGVALARLGGLKTDFSDISPAALSLARENAARHNVEGRFYESDLFSAVPGKYDLIACNPPYLTRAQMETRQRELLAEPENALFGGEDGLDLYRRIAGEYRAWLNAGGTLLLEVGAGQAEAVEGLLRANADTPVETQRLRDLNGIERVVTARPCQS